MTMCLKGRERTHYIVNLVQLAEQYLGLGSDSFLNILVGFRRGWQRYLPDEKIEPGGALVLLSVGRARQRIVCSGRR